MANVPANLTREVFHRREDATCQQVALNASEPELDLVEPRRVGRREVEVHVRVSLEEGGHRPRLVGRQVVENHMNLALTRLAGDEVAQKRDERRARVSGHRLAEHLATHGGTGDGGGAGPRKAKLAGDDYHELSGHRASISIIASESDAAFGSSSVGHLSCVGCFV